MENRKVAKKITLDKVFHRKSAEIKCLTDQKKEQILVIVYAKSDFFGTAKQL